MAIEKDTLDQLLSGRDPKDVFLISTVTDAVLETVAEWRNRLREAMYPLVFFDALRVKIRGEGLVCNKAVLVALAFQTRSTLCFRKRSCRPASCI